MSEPVRKGQFAKGTSGNRRGRPKSAKHRLETPEDLNEVIMDVMNMPVRASSGDKTVTLFEAIVRNLATGKAENRLAAVHTIQLMRQAAFANEKRLAREEKQRQVLEERALMNAVRSEYG